MLPEKFPFSSGYGDALGRGQDNVVVLFKDIEDKVLKWNHDLRKNEVVNTEQFFQRVLYKKKKYELLRFFLGDFIPESSFVLGHKKDGETLKTKEYTVQERVPNVTISQLSYTEQQSSKLWLNLYKLILKLQNMYLMLDRVNNIVGKNGQIDGKLDLGGLSKYAQNHTTKPLKKFDWHIINYDMMSSPNLLVDPSTMSLSCVDFGQGVWNREKEATLTLLKILASNNKEVTQVINL
jgi:hypothetical protein